jgi:5-methylcytosine-specific restriction endonuclease McrA
MIRRTLLLNASYEPLTLVTSRRAVVLVLSERAEIVHEGSEEFRSAKIALRVPSVIRLLTFVKVPYRARVPLTRRAVLTRDKHICQYCQKKADTIDHVVPRSRGGKHEWENLVACCRPCNGKKDNCLLSDLGWKLRRQPFAPRGTFWLIIGVGVIEEAWEPYIGAAA